MFIVHVFVRVKPESVEAFVAATIDNARASLKERGIARFDIIRQQDDATSFVLIEVYRNKYDPASHKETEHYRKWNEAVEGMMAEPRRRVTYDNVFPGENGWDSPGGKTHQPMEQELEW